MRLAGEQVGTWEEGKQLWLEDNGASMKYNWYLDEGQVLLGRKRIGSYPADVKVGWLTVPH